MPRLGELAVASSFLDALTEVIDQVCNVSQDDNFGITQISSKRCFER